MTDSNEGKAMQEPPFDDLDPIGIRAACAEGAINCIGGDGIAWSEIRESAADVQPLVAQLRESRAEVQRLRATLAGGYGCARCDTDQMALVCHCQRECSSEICSAMDQTPAPDVFHSGGTPMPDEAPLTGIELARRRAPMAEDISERDCDLCRAPIATGTCMHVLIADARVTMSRVAWERQVAELVRLRNLEASINDGEAATANAPRTWALPDGAEARVRIVVVVNRRRGSVHGMTADNAEAQRWTRELIDSYRDELAASQYVGLVKVGPGSLFVDALTDATPAAGQDGDGS